jgi:hypothetical protein
LALKIAQGVPGTAEFRSAAHLSMGEVALAQRAFQEDRDVRRSDLAAGHFFLRANLTDTVRGKLSAINNQLAECGLSNIHIGGDIQSLRLDQFQNSCMMQIHGGPLVSIIVPAFNAGGHLRMSLNSLLEQSYQNIEIIVVNDGSTDNTKFIIADFVARDSRVRAINLKENGGVYAARNTALKESLGNFITVHDADDFAHYQKIERQVIPLINNNMLAFSISEMVRISVDGMIARRDIYPLQRLNVSSLTFRREVVLRDWGYWQEERYGADSEFFFRLRRRYSKDRWVRLRQPLTFAAEHSGSLTMSVSTGQIGVPVDPRRIAYTESYTMRSILE